MFDIARNAIRSKLYGGAEFRTDEKKVTESLRKPLGAFVTLKENGVLRGCIGRFVSSEPLYEVLDEVEGVSSQIDLNGPQSLPSWLTSEVPPAWLQGV